MAIRHLTQEATGKAQPGWLYAWAEALTSELIMRSSGGSDAINDDFRRIESREQAKAFCAAGC